MFCNFDFNIRFGTDGYKYSKESYIDIDADQGGAYPLGLAIKVDGKWHEIQEFVKNTEPELIEEVEDLIWKPKGRSDYRRLKPELILTSNTIEIKKKTIWGDEYYQEYLQDEKLVRHMQQVVPNGRDDFKTDVQ